MREPQVGARLGALGRAVLARARGARWRAPDARWEREAHARGTFTHKNLVIFGDSQAAGWPLRRTFGTLPVRSRGLDGDLAAVARARFEREVIPLRPSAVLVVLGTNDVWKGRAVGAIAADLQALAARATEAGIRPTLAGVLPVGPAHEPQRPTPTLVALNGALRTVAASAGIFYLDFFEKLADDANRFRAELTADDLHPNLEGYRRMTEAVLEVFYCRSGQWRRDSPAVW